MAGIRGKSGGSRANTGGARVGAGRKKKESTNIEVPPKENGDDPRQFLINAMKNCSLDDRLRLDAAKSLMPFMYVKKGEGGKKDEKHEAAKKAGAGKFSPAAPPRLAIVHPSHGKK